MSDIYPGWADFKDILDRLISKVKAEKDQIADDLVREAKKLSAKDRCACGDVTKDEILAAIAHPKGKGYDWKLWTGKFEGEWHSADGQNYEDAEDWREPQAWKPTSQDAEDGVPKGKKCSKQDVIWVDPKDKSTGTRHGWNVSSDDDDYVWGWDPKEDDPPAKHGENGAHIGYPFDHGPCRCIVWVTLKFAYLECVFEDAQHKKCRFSVERRSGHGTWKT